LDREKVTDSTGRSICLTVFLGFLASGGASLLSAGFSTSAGFSPESVCVSLVGGFSSAGLSPAGCSYVEQYNQLELLTEQTRT